MFALAAAVLSAQNPSLQVELRSKDQALLDAIAPGDRATWDRTLTRDAVYVDENGTVMDRPAFLKALDGLPSYASGQIKIVDYNVRQDGDTALVVHKDDESELYYGIPLRAQYLMTETWLRQEGEWRLALVHAYVVANDPPAVTLARATLDQYVGRYRMAKDVIYVIRWDGDHLVGGTEGKPAHPLLAEASDLFFMSGQPRSRKLFRRDAHGAILDFVDRREGEDLVFSRM